MRSAVKSENITVRCTDVMTVKQVKSKNRLPLVEHHQPVVNNLVFYLGGTGFWSQAGDRLSWLSIFVYLCQEWHVVHYMPLFYWVEKWVHTCMTDYLSQFSQTFIILPTIQDSFPMDINDFPSVKANRTCSSRDANNHVALLPQFYTAYTLYLVKWK